MLDASISALVFDYDRTLTKEMNLVPSILQQTINELQNKTYVCTLNTGMSYPMLDIKVGDQIKPNAPLILEVGGRMVYSDGTFCHQTPLSTEEIKGVDTCLQREEVTMAAFGSATQSAFYIYTSDPEYYRKKFNYQFPEHWLYTNKYEFRNLLYAEGAVRAVLEGATEEFAISINSDFPGSVARNGDIYELTSYGVNKGEALQRWAEMQELKMDEIAVFGDNMNDLDMFQQDVGMKVQVGGHTPSLGQYSTHQVADAEELAFFLRGRFLCDTFAYSR